MHVERDGDDDRLDFGIFEQLAMVGVLLDAGGLLVAELLDQADAVVVAVAVQGPLEVRGRRSAMATMSM